LDTWVAGFAGRRAGVRAPCEPRFDATAPCSFQADQHSQTPTLQYSIHPTGLLAANLLADAGIEVQLIDREERTATRSYACALHTRSLKLLSELGLAEAALRQGRRISAMAFYDGEVRCAEARFSELDEEFPFLLVLPQSALEDLLEQRLRKKAGASLHWNHRFDGFEAEEHALVANVEKLGGTAVGYIVPHWETVVEKRFAVRTQFVIGADGHNSLVRHRAGIEYQRLHEPQSFVACEFTCDSGERDELRVVLDQGTTNVLWPLPGDEFRWTFQLIHSEVSGEFPEKQRRQTSAAEPLLNERIRAGIQRLAKQRAPWFVSKVNEINWCSQVVFQQGLAREFGRGRCWLAGDAGHQTGPVGVQSMNAGLGEAQELATCLYSILRE
jgi:2-polyprenyl-6-methoxyphenol hydroxylase-like FAD-dependent oxidoreductase